MTEIEREALDLLSAPVAAWVWAQAVMAWLEVLIIAAFWGALLAGSGWLLVRLCRAPTTDREE